MDYLCTMPKYQHFIIVVIISCIELWLGKTDKTKSGSIIELIFNSILALGLLFIRRKNGNRKESI